MYVMCCIKYQPVYNGDHRNSVPFVYASRNLCFNKPITMPSTSRGRRGRMVA